MSSRNRRPAKAVALRRRSVSKAPRAVAAADPVKVTALQEVTSRVRDVNLTVNNALNRLLELSGRLQGFEMNGSGPGGASDIPAPSHDLGKLNEAVNDSNRLTDALLAVVARLEEL